MDSAQEPDITKEKNVNYSKSLYSIHTFEGGRTLIRPKLYFRTVQKNHCCLRLPRDYAAQAPPHMCITAHQQRMGCQKTTVLARPF